MKRVICLLIVIAMMAVCCVSVAEENESSTDEHLKELGMMSLLYNLAPDDFGQDYIMRTYLDLMIYMNTEQMDSFNLGYYLTKDRAESVVDYMRKYALSITNIIQIATDGYEDWLNGKMTDKEYLDVLMALVDGIIDINKK